MYFWNTEKLAEEIKKNNVSENDWKNYYLATSVFLLASIYVGALSPRTGGVTLFVVEALLIIAITIFGINFTYKTNEVLNGGNYIPRITALGFPILIKIFTLSLLLGLIVGILAGAHLIEAGSDRIPFTIFTVAAQVVFFWRINVHLTNINT